MNDLKLFFISLFLLLLGFGFLSVVNAQSVNNVSNFNVEPVSSCKFKVGWDYDDISNKSFEIKRKKENGPYISDLINSSELIEDNENNYYFKDGNNDDFWKYEDLADLIDPNDNYSYLIRVYDELTGIYSSWGSDFSVSSLNLPPEPSAPKNLDLEILGNENLELNWSQGVSDELSSYGGFIIESKNSNDGSTYNNNYERLYVVSLDQFNDGKYFYENQFDKDKNYKFRIKSRETGGEGCDFEREEHFIDSNYSGEIEFPARPYNLETETTSDGSNRKIKVTWEDRSAEDKFIIYRSLNSDFSNSISLGEVNQDKKIFIDENVRQTGDETYYYKIESCKNGICSYKSEVAVGHVGVLAPKDFKSKLIYSDSVSGNVYFSWNEDGLVSGSQLSIDFSKDGGNYENLVKLNTTNQDRVNGYIIESLELGHNYNFKIYNTEDGVDSSSSEFSLNLNIDKKIEGAAFAGESGPEGIGWISFSDNNYSYSVQIDNEGYLSGLAWADDYGWLSFNKSDITSRDRVKIDSNGNLSGFAKFLNLDENYEGAWSGWISFGGNGYGVKLEEDGYFYGAAWGDDVGGWIVFGPTDNGTGDTACVDGGFAGSDENMENIIVKTNEATDRMSCGDDEEEEEDKYPVILNLEVLDYDSIKINWENPMYYEDGLDIYYKLENGNYELVTYYNGKDAEIGEGSFQYTKDNLGFDTEYTFKVVGKIKSDEYQSNEVSARTDSYIDPVLDESYSFWCNSLGQDEIDVYWDGPSEGYTLVLSKKLNYSNSYNEIYNSDGGSGNYKDLSLGSGETWDYKLEVNGPESDVLTSTCTTWNEDVEAPSNLKVWGVDEENLHINWRDNAVESHNFKIQRIKVTPEDSSFNHSSNKKIEVYNLSDGVGSYSDRLNVYWQNNTNVEDKLSFNNKIQKSPYYHIIERTSILSENGYPFDDINQNNDFEPDGSDYYDSSFVSMIKNFPEDKNYNSDKVDYNFVDYELDEATTYYYRTKACSYIKVDTNKNGDLENICSNNYSSVEHNTTAPNKPTNFRVTSDTKNSITLSWNDNSEGEDGYKIYRKVGSGYKLTETLGPNSTKFTDRNLSSDTVYNYRIRAYKNNPDGGIVYSGYDPLSAKTDFIVSVIFSGDEGAGGRVTDNKGRMNCTENCSVSYDNSIVLSAEPDTDSIFSGWSGDCEGDVCGLSSNSTVNVIFQKDKYKMQVNIVGDGMRIESEPEGINCLAGDDDCFHYFDNGTNVVLNATSSGVWTGCDSDTGDTCNVTMDENKSININFGGSTNIFNKNKTYKTVLQNTKNFLSDVASFNVLNIEKNNGITNNKLASLSEGEFGKDVSKKLMRGINIVKDKLISLIKKVDAAPIITPSLEEGEDVIINYFKQFEKNLDFDSNPGYFKDVNVNPKTVYVYRVKVVYDSGRETAYSSLSGGKTLPDGNYVSEKRVGICTRNSFCSRLNESNIRDSLNQIIYEPENQCNTNADCRNIGTMTRFIEEQ
jgi:hypothetical protein